MQGHKYLEHLFEKYRVILFLYGTTSSPSRSKSKEAVNWLRHFDIEFHDIDVTNNFDLQSQIKSCSGWHLFPQLFVDGEFIGGSFIIPEFLNSGELHRILGLVIKQDFHCLSHNYKSIWKIKVCKDESFFATASADGTIMLRNCANLKIEAVLLGHRWVNCIDILLDSKLIVSGSSDTKVRLYNFNGNLLQSLNGHTRWVNEVAFLPDYNIIVSVSADRTIKLWDIGIGTEIASVKAHNECIWSLCILHDNGSIVTCSADGIIIIWDLLTLRPIKYITAHDSCITSVVSFGINEFVTASFDKTIKRWSAQGNFLGLYTGHFQRIWSVASAKNNRIIVSASADKSVIIWDTAQKNMIKKLSFDDTPIACQFYSNDTKLLVGFDNGEILSLNLS